MLACVFSLLLVFPVIVVTSLLENRFSTDELSEMGVRLEYLHQ
jgi:hypothetical protein